MIHKTTLRLPYPTEITLNEHKMTGLLTEITDDGETRTVKILLDIGSEFVSTTKSNGNLVETITDDSGVSWARTVDTDPDV